MTFPARPRFPLGIGRATALHFKSAKSRQASRHGRPIQSARNSSWKDSPRFDRDRSFSFRVILLFTFFFPSFILRRLEERRGFFMTLDLDRFFLTFLLGQIGIFFH